MAKTKANNLVNNIFGLVIAIGTDVINIIHENIRQLFGYKTLIPLTIT